MNKLKYMAALVIVLLPLLYSPLTLADEYVVAIANPPDIHDFICSLGSSKSFDIMIYNRSGVEGILKFKIDIENTIAPYVSLSSSEGILLDRNETQQITVTISPTQSGNYSGMVSAFAVTEIETKNGMVAQTVASASCLVGFSVPAHPENKPPTFPDNIDDEPPTFPDDTDEENVGDTAENEFVVEPEPESPIDETIPSKVLPETPSETPEASDGWPSDEGSVTIETDSGKNILILIVLGVLFLLVSMYGFGKYLKKKEPEKSGEQKVAIVMALFIMFVLSASTGYAGEDTASGTAGSINVSPNIENLIVRTISNVAVTEVERQTYYKYCVTVRDNNSLADIENVELRLYYPVTNVNGEDTAENHYTFYYDSTGWNEPSDESNTHIDVSSCQAPDNDLAEGSYIFVCKLAGDAVLGSWTARTYVLDENNNSAIKVVSFTVIKNVDTPPTNGPSVPVYTITVTPDQRTVDARSEITGVVTIKKTGESRLITLWLELRNNDNLVISEITLIERDTIYSIYQENFSIGVPLVGEGGYTLYVFCEENVSGRTFSSQVEIEITHSTSTKIIWFIHEYGIWLVAVFIPLLIFSIYKIARRIQKWWRARKLRGLTTQ